jgi:hypothetical protein
MDELRFELLENGLEFIAFGLDYIARRDQLDNQPHDHSVNDYQ